MNNMIQICSHILGKKENANFFIFFSSKLCCVLQIDVTAMIWYIELNFTNECHTEY